MKELAINKIFTQSGCLTLVALEKYSSGDLPIKDQKIIQAHLDKCNLCADALEGFELLPDKENSNKTITEINKSLNEKLLKENTKDLSSIFSGKLFYFSAAASILILIGVLFYLNFSANRLNPNFSNYTIPQDIEMPLPPTAQKDVWKNTHLNDVVGQEKADHLEEKQIVKPEKSEKLNYIKINISDIEEEPFVDEELEISMDIDVAGFVEKNKGKKQNNNESFLMEMIMVNNGSNKKGGPSAPEQYPYFNHEQNLQDKTVSTNEEINQQETIFTIVETMPQFPGGETGLREYLQNNLSYPPKARKAGTEGKVYVSFVVNSSGKVMDANVLKGVGAGCDEMALRAIERMPLWKPATQQGKAVSVRFVVPIFFNLHIN